VSARVNDVELPISRHPHQGSVHRPSLGGGPMTTIKRNKSAATTTRLAAVTF